MIRIQSDDSLNCPGCGSDNLHHERVDVFERCEDAERGLHVTVSGIDNPICSPALVSIGDSLDGNPSARRQGLTIRFWCEQCDLRPVLSISQHKGTTYMQWSSPR